VCGAAKIVKVGRAVQSWREPRQNSHLPEFGSFGQPFLHSFFILEVIVCLQHPYPQQVLK
jgi:hypothetical protein